ncbi:MAG: TIGR03032 family protein [Planctomycetaceae bacterium]
MADVQGPEADVLAGRQGGSATLDATAPLIQPEPITCEPTVAVVAAPQPTLTSQHTSSFAELLDQLGISLAVTTYQAGKLVLLSAENGTINTHFQSFNKPMGLAVAGDRLAIGTALEIWEYHNAPAVAKRVGRVRDGESRGSAGEEGTGTQQLTLDSCFLPRGSQTTGDIQIHEMLWTSFNRTPQARAFPSIQAASHDQNAHACGLRLNESVPSGESELWFINTRFSCLCTRDFRYTFVPRWRPPFISAIAPEDRCHLNGFCEVPPSFNRTPQARAFPSIQAASHDQNAHACGLRLNEPSFFVTALGETDTQGGWRADKRSGGILMETGSNEVLLRGLSMPHSPRVFNNQLWVCESGTGTIGRVDLQAGRYEPIASLPGFTRGVDFHGRYAFIGLSQVRESAVFSGIPIAERPLSERACGVWVIDMVTGETVAWLKFDDGVQEIFAVTVLPNSRWPDLINDQPKLIADSFILPDESLDSVPVDLRFIEAHS